MTLLDTFSIFLLVSGMCTIVCKAQEPGANEGLGPPDCQLELDIGVCPPGGAEVQPQPRFYYNTVDGECQAFDYSGCGGNLNNFNNVKKCNERCVCSQRFDNGTGTESLRRFFYNKATDKCERFFFSGSGGNANNFAKRLDCNKACVNPFSRAKCNKRPAWGNARCSGAEVSTQYYYDNFCDCCRPFIYSGCGGNDNRFPSFTECLNDCSLVVTPPASTTVPPITPPTTIPPTLPPTNPPVPGICYLRPNFGNCVGISLRFYYDPNVGGCRLFLYSGCGGNENNFRSVNDCTRRCSL